MQLISHNVNHRQSGFALIEVLVTAVIFAIGISGMGVLLLKTIQATQDNAQRSQGMWIVQDFVGRIRANPEGAKAGGYVTAGVNCKSDRPAAMCADHIISNVEVAGVNCIPAAMAAFDIWVTMCGFDDPTPTDPADKIFDSPAEFLVNSVLTSSCEATNSAGCVQYAVNLTWSSKIKKGAEDEADRINQNNYSMVVELN